MDFSFLINSDKYLPKRGKKVGIILPNLEKKFFFFFFCIEIIVGLYIIAYLLLFSYEPSNGISLSTQLFSWVSHYFLPGIIGILLLFVSDLLCKLAIRNLKLRNPIVYFCNIVFNLGLGYFLGVYSVLKFFVK
ncbi:hypothetical protein MAQA_02932 [Listeria aquatica FSL S10-1188]|uniref:Uncharacterized protein n=1 Tax=Listeria aquatica FSL S10-1188 TaxID=1265818 RepID=W7B6S1_9LIST|nr:hypothetical protein MAQA_02932 [Listeria aquatica FSL S10-1188]